MVSEEKSDVILSCVPLQLRCFLSFGFFQYFFFLSFFII